MSIRKGTLQTSSPRVTCVVVEPAPPAQASIQSDTKDKPPQTLPSSPSHHITNTQINMDPRTIFVSLSHGSMVGLSLFGVANSYLAITNLQGYEATTKKLAKWSTVVEQELHKTRTTQASGAVAVRLPLLNNMI